MQRDDSGYWMCPVTSCACDGMYMIEYTNSQIKHLISEHIHNERNRRILERRLVDGIGFEDLAEEFDMSVRQVKTIVYKQQKVLFGKLMHCF